MPRDIRLVSVNAPCGKRANQRRDRYCSIDVDAKNINDIQFAPSSSNGSTDQLLAAACTSGDIHLFHMPTDILDVTKMPRVLSHSAYRHNSPALCLTFTNATTLFAGLADGRIVRYRLDTKEDGVLFGQHNRDVTCLAVTNNLLISGSLDHKIKLWNVWLSTEDGGSPVKVVNFGGEVRSLDASDEYLIAGGADGLIKIWSLYNAGGAVLAKRHCPIEGPIRRLRIIPEDPHRRFCAAVDGGLVWIQRVDNARNTRVPLASQFYARSADCTLEQYFESQPDDDADAFSEDTPFVHDVVVHPTEKTVAAAGSDGCIDVLDPFYDPLRERTKAVSSIEIDDRDGISWQSRCLALSTDCSLLAAAVVGTSDDSDGEDVKSSWRIVLCRMDDESVCPQNMKHRPYRMPIEEQVRVLNTVKRKISADDIAKHWEGFCRLLEINKIPLASVDETMQRLNEYKHHLPVVRNWDDHADSETPSTSSSCPVQVTSSTAYNAALSPAHTPSMSAQLLNLFQPKQSPNGYDITTPPQTRSPRQALATATAIQTSRVNATNSLATLATNYDPEFKGRFEQRYREWTSAKRYHYIIATEEDYSARINAILNRNSGLPIRQNCERNWNRIYSLRNNKGVFRLYHGEKEVLKQSEVFNIVHDAHIRSGHAGRDLMRKGLVQYHGLSKEIVELYLSMCDYCHTKRLKAKGRFGMIEYLQRIEEKSVLSEGPTEKSEE